MADVFVSYSRANRDRAGELAGAIGESGYSTWWDARLAPSADYAQVIERELEAAGAVVVAWSATARASLWVRAEANEALDAGKLVQLTIDGAKLPLPFTALHFLDFRRWRGERRGSPWTELEGGIGTLLGGGRIDAEPGVREPALQGLALPVILGWAALGLAIVMAFAIGAVATGALAPGLFASLAAAGFGAGTVLLALIAVLAIRVLRASRR
ncbi:MAG TPA: toll/interleukin-1 receptor domain-containing protein [Allosphingosinicella sp.]|jgi:hypothetical protein